MGSSAAIPEAQLRARCHDCAGPAGLSCSGAASVLNPITFLGSFGTACDFSELKWGYRSRLIQYKSVSNSTAGQVTEQHSYSYDCFGRRLTKTAWEGITRHAGLWS